MNLLTEKASVGYIETSAEVGLNVIVIYMITRKNIHRILAFKYRLVLLTGSDSLKSLYTGTFKAI